MAQSFSLPLGGGEQSGEAAAGRRGAESATRRWRRATRQRSARNQKRPSGAGEGARRQAAGAGWEATEAPALGVRPAVNPSSQRAEARRE